MFITLMECNTLILKYSIEYYVSLNTKYMYCMYKVVEGVTGEIIAKLLLIKHLPLVDLLLHLAHSLINLLLLLREAEYVPAAAELSIFKNFEIQSISKLK